MTAFSVDGCARVKHGGALKPVERLASRGDSTASSESQSHGRSISSKCTTEVLQAVRVPNALDRGRTDPLRFRHGPRAPVRGRARPGLRRGRHDLPHLGAADGGWPATTRTAGAAPIEFTRGGDSCNLSTRDHEQSTDCSLFSRLHLHRDTACRMFEHPGTQRAGRRFAR